MYNQIYGTLQQVFHTLPVSYKFQTLRLILLQTNNRGRRASGLDALLTADTSLWVTHSTVTLINNHYLLRKQDTVILNRKLMVKLV